jgi:regulator of sirC expression with transglutaminase-like and TPR domain
MNDKEINALISLLDDEDKEVIAHVEEKLISLGGSAIPFLEKEWEKSFNPLQQKRIEELIHTMQFNVLKQRLAVWVETGGKDLLEGMWILSTYAYPDTSFAEIKKEIEQLYYEVWLEFRYDMRPSEQIKLLNDIFFNKMKFQPNTKNFHSPANSILKSVLETRKGNPISLCSIYMLIANKLKMPVYGVNLPNLFILTYKSNELQFYINAFNKGLIFSKTDIESYIAQLKLPYSPVYYEPCSHIEIIKRMSRNLLNAYERLGDTVKMTEIKELIEMMNNAE